MTNRMLKLVAFYAVYCFIFLVLTLAVGLAIDAASLMGQAVYRLYRRITGNPVAKPWTFMLPRLLAARPRMTLRPRRF